MAERVAAAKKRTAAALEAARAAPKVSAKQQPPPSSSRDAGGKSAAKKSAAAAAVDGGAANSELDAAIAKLWTESAVRRLGYAAGVYRVGNRKNVATTLSGQRVPELTNDVAAAVAFAKASKRRTVSRRDVLAAYAAHKLYVVGVAK